MGIPALVSFRDRIAGTRCGHAAFPGAESPAGLGTRLHCDVCRPRDRHHPRRIRARCATTRRGDIVTCGRLDKLAQAANRLSVTDSTVTGSEDPVGFSSSFRAMIGFIRCICGMIP